MGTRGSFGFRVNGQDKLMYNHFDSYPSGLGLDVLAFLKGTNLDTLTKKVAKLEPVNNKVPPTPEQIAKCTKAGTVNLSVSERSTKDWYCLLRNAQGDFKKLLKVGLFEPANNFILDSLFCEWAYIANLDTGKLEVYQGFNEGLPNPAGGIGQTPVDKWVPKLTGGRYAAQCDLEDNKSRIERGEAPFFGVALIAEFPLKKLPASKTFIAKTERE